MAGSWIPSLARVRLLSDHTARRSTELAQTADIFYTGISGSPLSPAVMPTIYRTCGTVATVSMLRRRAQWVKTDCREKYVSIVCADRYYASIDMPTVLNPQTIITSTIADQN